MAVLDSMWCVGATTTMGYDFQKSIKIIADFYASSDLPVVTKKEPEGSWLSDNIGG
jgi:hypothetical protein